jgi:hypothetical protein
MKKMLFVLSFPLFLCQCTTYNQDITNKTQLVFGAKMRLDLSGDKNTNLQISVTGGASQSVFDNYLMLFYQPSLIIYQGGLGSQSTFKNINKFRFEIVNSFGTNIGFRQMEAQNTEGSLEQRPLINWSVSNATALYNPYAYSLALSSNFIWSNAKNADETRQVQRIGFGSISVPHFVFGYANDGPPFDLRLLPLGDGYDRYWTGRGFAQLDFNAKYRGDKFNDFSRWQLTAEYDRFTGFLRDNYEAANILGLRFVPYGTESAWNKGRWSLSLVNKTYNLGFLLGGYNNDRTDIQNIIHREERYPFHGSAYKQAISFGLLYGFQNKIP